MAIPNYYPPAEQLNDGRGEGDWSGIGKWKLVLHTTETPTVPEYAAGELVPHITYYAKNRTWHQHVPFSRPAESLKTFDDDQSIQVEIVCYSAKSIADAKPLIRTWVGDLTSDNLSDLATFTKWLQKYLPIQSEWPEKQAFSYSQANAAGFRMTSKQFWEYDGILGHQHVPFPNDHWDPGAFNWNAFMQLLQGENMWPIGPTQNNNKEDQRMVQDMLNRTYGTSIIENGVWEQSTIDAIVANLASATGDANAKAGKYMVSNQYDQMLVDLMDKRIAAAGSVDGGITQAEADARYALKSKFDLHKHDEGITGGPVT